MSFTLKTTTEAKDAANFIAQSIIHQLDLNKHVLFFLTGGSSIAVGIETAKIISKHQPKYSYQNLIITLTDERYGPLDHPNSNWQQLLEKGFSLPQAKLIPILTGDDRNTTTKKFNMILNQEFMTTAYKIGLFGIGLDGHTAGILPNSDAVKSEDLAFSYNTPTFSRITITPKAIKKLDEAVIWMQGKEKWKIIQDLEKDIPVRNAFSITDADGDIIKQPAQILKKVPLLTIFTDYKKI